VGNCGRTVSELTISHLSHHFGSRAALRDVSFRATAGSFNVLLGPNGAGKTTLISLLSGLYYPRSGSINVFGHSMRERPTQVLRSMGVVFQHTTLDLDLSVYENLRYQASLYGLPSGIAKRRQREELGRIGVAERLNEPARHLSGGMRRRVEIAAALLHQPRLLLLDEPTVGLDVGTRRFILGHIRRLCHEQGLTVLWATHLLDEIETTDTVLLLHNGDLLWTGSPDGLLTLSGKTTLPDAFLSLTEQRPSFS
jgi:ABC-2 type transport system ATP-binding protein